MATSAMMAVAVMSVLFCTVIPSSREGYRPGHRRTGVTA
jgi:hypothetical protein